MRNAERRLAVAAAVAAVSALALAGCVAPKVEANGNLPSPHQSQFESSRATAGSARPSALAEGGPLEVAGLPMVLDNRHVAAACFEFDLPQGAEYELHPESGACVGAVNWMDSDALTATTLKAYEDDDLLATIREVLASHGSTVNRETTYVVEGRQVPVITSLDELGLERAFAVVPLPEGAFELDGIPLNSIMVTSYVDGGGQMEAMFRSLVESITIPD